MLNQDWLPNWKNEDDYNYIDEWNHEPGSSRLQIQRPHEIFRWAWEFLRRNNEYQKDFGIYNEFMEIHDYWKAHEWNREIVRKYKLNEQLSSLYLPDPKDNFPKNTCLAQLFDINTPPALSGLRLESMKYIEEYQVYGTRELDLKKALDDVLPKNRYDMIAKFDLTRPIKPQIDKLRKYFEETQKLWKILNHEFKLINKNKQDYLLLIRLLDAKSSHPKPKNIEIIRELFPEIYNRKLRIFKNDKREFNKACKNLIDDNNKAAKLLRDENYYLIPLTHNGLWYSDS